MKKTIFLRTILILLLVGWMAFIFVMSSKPAVESSQLSGGFVDKIIDIIYRDFDSFSSERQLSIVNTTTLIVRKAAHFLEFFVLGVLSAWFAATFKNAKGILKFPLAATFSIIYAVSDEIHQRYVPGRACRFLDIGIDSAGIICAVGLIALIAMLVNRRRSGERKVNKKTLKEENLSLFEQLQKTQGELIELKKLLENSTDEINSLKQQLTDIKSVETKPVVIESTVTEPLRRLEEKVITNANLKPDVEYGSAVIGKLVMIAAEYSNKLTIGGDESKKELVNLILGKTEVAKSEILSVIEGRDSFDVKCSRMDEIANATKEYFESVMAQIV